MGDSAPDPENLLQDLSIDPDDYGTVAATDNPTATAAAKHDRNHVSEAQFAATKAAYVAKHDDGNIYLTLESVLGPPDREEKTKIRPKNVQLIAAAVGELYFFKRFDVLRQTLDWLREGYDVDSVKLRGKKLSEVMREWEGRIERAEAREKDAQE